MTKVVSLRGVKYEKMYRDFFKDANNCNFAKKCFLASDVKIINKNKIS